VTAEIGGIPHSMITQSVDPPPGFRFQLQRLAPAPLPA